ncbi:unnamed protein product [Onchocerca flexuosa]|uniref:Uncharacterized protein n=1 Tax=Onchocerca flexuosa TaxID=387005 RepID=A0A183HXT0_9BILA|nr:unnamed protein product [Onchocerca flexuosa]
MDENPTEADSGATPVATDSQAVTDSDGTVDAAAEIEGTPGPVKAGNDEKLPATTIAIITFTYFAILFN